MRVVAPAGLIADRYRLLSPLGSGASATVWAAADQTLGRQVALKLLSSAAAADSVEREQLRREARALAALKHPHVIVVFDFLETPGFDGAIQPVLVTELLEGRSLAARLAEGPLPWPEALSVCGQLAAALAAAHRAGIVHRDVAPGNVMLTGAGVKLLDFGLAEAIATAKEPSDDGTTVGTPVCMAPEQLMGRGALPASDVYALGCVLHWCLTGRPPYRDRDLVWLSQAHLRAEPPPLTIPGLPDSISDLYFASLAKEPDERPTAGAAAATLAPYAPASVLTSVSAATSTAAAAAAAAASTTAAVDSSVSASTDEESLADGPTELLPVVVSVSAGATEHVSAAADATSPTSAGTTTAGSTAGAPPPPTPSRHAGRGHPIDRRRLLPLAVSLAALTIIGLMMFGLAQTMDGTGTSATRTTGAATASATSATSTTPPTAASATATVGSVILPSGSASGTTSGSPTASAAASMSASAPASASPPMPMPPSQAPSMAGVALPAPPDPVVDPLGFVQVLGDQVQVLIGQGPGTLQANTGQNLINALSHLQNLVVTAQQHPGNKQWRDVANAITALEQQISNAASAGQISADAANVLVGELQSLAAALPTSNSNGNG